MKPNAAIALSLLATGFLCGPGLAESPEGYVAEVVLLRNGEVVGRTTLPMGPDGTFKSYAENTRDYRHSVSTDGAGQVTKKVAGRLVTGFDVRIGYRRDGEDLILDAQASYSELAGMDTFTTGGQTIDLPNVNQWSLKDVRAATPSDGGWSYQATDAGRLLTLSVNLKPSTL